MTPPRPVWDASRFLQTLVYFEAVPVVSWVQRMLSGGTPIPPFQPEVNVLFDFGQSTTPLGERWGSLDDGVMGGVSTSSFSSSAGAALFSGVVSTANSGGFASVRTRNFEPPLDLSSCAGLELRIKGDGQRYKFLIRDEETWDSVAYASSFDTVADQWLTIQLPFTQMVPVFRAKTVNTARRLNTAQIRSLQLMLSKFEYDGVLNPHFVSGEFRLLIQSIRLYK
ncbi:complex I intermediate-associated protein 30 (CIA30) [Leptolyngbya sp. 'hensonii']|uniref:CIA30 family protein n=1 Tax=Leptolyngbya sp. 'hensonii' TaxID=1922337 RepID=UPI00094F5D86|nr:CIA30 family protein [Leptolyngbya sp. 'hensonii']OLP16369.1 complex I intermediate-associated protein 30 (CIA30) [Leptolyngbya sp. 'hensonii']